MLIALLRRASALMMSSNLKPTIGFQGALQGAGIASGLPRCARGRAKVGRDEPGKASDGEQQESFYAPSVVLNAST